MSRNTLKAMIYASFGCLINAIAIISVPILIIIKLLPGNRYLIPENTHTGAIIPTIIPSTNYNNDSFFKSLGVLINIRIV